MPPKGRKVHNTRSNSGSHSRLHSPLKVQADNNLAKAKNSKQAKTKLKSIVKVVNNPQAKTKTKHVSFQQVGSAQPASQLPLQMLWLSGNCLL